MWRKRSVSGTTTGGTQRFSEMPPHNWDSAKQEFFQTGEADPLLAWRTADVDAMVLAAQHDLLAQASVALLAVGGYGRRQLFPYSDIDLLLLFENDRAVESSKKTIAPFLQRLWDSGLRMSHSVRTPGECAELHDQNIELNISLLDVRFLGGDEQIYGALNRQLPRLVHGRRQSLIRNLAQLTTGRRGKFQDTFYHLEPNIKESPGGLRDYQLLCWLSRIANSTADALGAVSPFPELDSARKFLFALRCYLHYEAGRDNNLLSFDAQEAIAELTRKPSAADFMRDYFRHARDIYHASSWLLEASDTKSGSLFSNFRDWRSRLSNSEFTVLRERVYLKSPQQLDQDPMLALRCFEFVARHGIRLSQDTGKRIVASLPTLRKYFAEARPIWTALRDFLSLPHLAIALDSMHETGALKAVFPEQEQIDCLVVRDFHHRYTVDEHTLTTIRILLGLEKSGEPGVKPYTELLSELENPAALYFALLYHDVGKGSPEEGHVDASLRICEGAMERIGMPEADREMVRFLIGKHLALSATMNSRDLEDPLAIELLAHRMETVERLKALTLLTYGDISAVNPGTMTPWRRSQLWRLYTLTYNELTRALNAERIEPRPADSPEKAAFLDGFPTRYLRTHSEKEINQHLAMEKMATSRAGAVIDLKKLEGAYLLTVVTADRPFLFASIAGTLSSFGMNILKAEAFANRRRSILDTFTFADPLRTLELNPQEIDRLKDTLERVVLGKTDITKLLRNRPPATLPSKGARFEPSLAFDSESSASATLIQIVAEDRTGLLYDLASAISQEGCNIEVVLIDTEAHKAIDVFYITAGGSKLDAAHQERLRERLLQAL
jgi:[protein-PII] uridylyltransferase